MPRKYSPSASKDVEREMTDLSVASRRAVSAAKGGTVKSRKQAIAIGLSEARKKERKFRKGGPASRSDQAD
jgi:hypothetical protein